MKRPLLLATILLTGCGEKGGDRTPARETIKTAVQVASLTGLYEARVGGEQLASLCMISDASGAASFALVSDGPNGGTCGGAGKAIREGEQLRLTLAGDEQCVIEAKIKDTLVTLPQGLPQGCAYYCAPNATLAGAIFEKVGGTSQDAMRAVDLAGDPLCS